MDNLHISYMQVSQHKKHVLFILIYMNTDSTAGFYNVGYTYRIYSKIENHV